MSGFGALLLLFLLFSPVISEDHHHHEQPASQLTPEQREAQFKAIMTFLQTSPITQITGVLLALFMWFIWFVQQGKWGTMMGAMLSTVMVGLGHPFVIFVSAAQIICILYFLRQEGEQREKTGVA